MTLADLDLPCERTELEAVQRLSDDLPPPGFLYALIRDGRVFSHSNRLMDARVESAILATYGTCGDVTAENTTGALLDVYGNAADMPKVKAVLAPYKVNGRTTNLLSSVLDRRPAGCHLVETLPATRTVSLDVLDKAVLLPVEVGKYQAILPKTPAWVYPALLGAVRLLGSEVLQQPLDQLREALNEKTKGKGKYKASDIPKWMGLNLRARAWKLSKAQNFSFHTNSIAGQIIQPLFLPPPLHVTSRKQRARTAKRWAENGFSAALFKRVIHKALELSGLFHRIAEQKHRRSGTEIRNEPVNDNAKTRAAYVQLGTLTAMMMREAIEEVPLPPDSPAGKVRESLLDDHKNDALIIDTWNIVNEHLSDPYRLDVAYELFREGFVQAFWFEAEEQASQTMPHGRSFQGMSRTEGGRYLRTSFVAYDADIGSTGISVGILSLTAIYGLLHRVVEREAGLPIYRFLPVFHEVQMNDHLAARKGVKLSLWGKDIKTALEQGEIPPEALSIGNPEAILNGKPTNTLPLKQKDKAINPPFCGDIKGRVRMTIIVDLGFHVDAGRAEALKRSIGLHLEKASLAGGPLGEIRVSFHEQVPKVRGFALARHMPGESNPLVEVFRSVAFHQREYLGQYPLGAVLTGYEGILDAGTVRLRGEDHPAQHAEGIYRIFRFIHASHDDRQWFALSVSREGEKTIFDLA